MATPHIRAEYGEIADTILLPGDPMRVKYIAERFLSNARLFSDVRNALGYTGEYKGKRISVMGTGMGIPSTMIYSHELFTRYGVKTAIRVGTCGAVKKGLSLKDVLIAQSCSTTSDINRLVFPGTFCPVADFELLRTAYLKARESGISVKVGGFLTTDMLYSPDETGRSGIWAEYGVLASEMEGAGLYTSALRCGTRALCMATVAGIPGGGMLSAEERERSLEPMITVALETAAEFAEQQKACN